MGRSSRRRRESPSVDSPAQIELVRPWRTATLVASGVAAVELVALVVLGLVLVGRSLAPHVHAAAAKAAREPKHAAAPAKHETRPKPVPPAHTARILPRAKTGVLVLNGNGINGAAAQAASIVRARGYAVTATKNAPRTGYPTWRLMTAPGYAAEAIRFARDLGLSRTRVGPLDGMIPKQLHGAKLVLILGTSR
jgi:LytR cell envelope-related transcriptional attenuator